MDWYWILPVILLLAAASRSSGTWSPFQSEQVKEICAHMTRDERRATAWRGAACGLLIALVFGMTVVLLGMVIWRSALVVVALWLLIFPLAVLLSRKKWWPQVVRSHQRFLASTEWAQSQGIKPEEIRLYTWQK